MGIHMEWNKFVEGGVASIIAGSATQPFDLVKVRMQLQGEMLSLQPAVALALGSSSTPHLTTAAVPCSLQGRMNPISMAMKIGRAEGVPALFSGVSATVLRQASYSTTRMGLYEILKTRWSNQGADGTPFLPLHKKIMAGLVAGAVGAVVGNPADVAMVRMQADGRLPVTLRRNYGGVSDALTRMVKEEGLASLWRGSGLTVQRAMLVTASQLATYDQAKEDFHLRLGVPDGFPLHVLSSFAAGFMASLASNPVDVIKTRIMNMKVQAGEEPPYKGPLDCLTKTIRAEGPLALYKGFVPTMLRQGPFTVVLFLSLEQMRKLFKHN